MTYPWVERSPHDLLTYLCQRSGNHLTMGSTIFRISQSCQILAVRSKLDEQIFMIRQGAYKTWMSFRFWSTVAQARWVSHARSLNLRAAWRQRPDPMRLCLVHFAMSKNCYFGWQVWRMIIWLSLQAFFGHCTFPCLEKLFIEVTELEL